MVRPDRSRAVRVTGCAMERSPLAARRAKCAAIAPDYEDNGITPFYYRRGRVHFSAATKSQMR